MMSTVLSVETKGSTNYDAFVRSYRLTYSNDCATFTQYINNIGQNVVGFLFVCNYGGIEVEKYLKYRCYYETTQ